MVESIDFQAVDAKKVSLKSQEKETAKGKGGLFNWIAVFAILLGAGIVFKITADAARPPAVENRPAPTPPPLPETPVSDYLLSYEDIQQIEWKDDPALLNEWLMWGMIAFDGRDHANSTVNINGHKKREGDFILGGDYQIVRIDMHVVFLKDEFGDIHRLVRYQDWPAAVQTYGWDPNDFPEPESLAARRAPPGLYEFQVLASSQAERPPESFEAYMNIVYGVLREYAEVVRESQARNPNHIPTPAAQAAYFQRQGIPIEVSDTPFTRPIPGNVVEEGH